MGSIFSKFGELKMYTSRMGDIGTGICVCHKTPKPSVGILVTGANTKLANFPPESRTVDLVIGDCGHVAMMVTGSPTAFVEGQNAARVLDIFTG
jgi:hypothetical protein